MSEKYSIITKVNLINKTTKQFNQALGRYFYCLNNTETLFLGHRKLLYRQLSYIYASLTLKDTL